MKIGKNLKSMVWKIVVYVLLGCFVICYLLVLCKAIDDYWQIGRTFTEKDSNKLAEFGEYFGGTLNTLFTAIGIGVNSILTIIVARWLLSSSSKQIEAEKKIVIIHLKQDALNEFRITLESKLQIWSTNPFDSKYASNCEKIIKDFISNYSYLFEVEIIDICESVAIDINKISKLSTNQSNDNVVELIFHETQSKCRALYSKIGKSIIETNV